MNKRAGRAGKRVGGSEGRRAGVWTIERSKGHGKLAGKLVSSAPRMPNRMKASLYMRHSVNDLVSLFYSPDQCSIFYLLLEETPDKVRSSMLHIFTYMHVSIAHPISSGLNLQTTFLIPRERDASQRVNDVRRAIELSARRVNSSGGDDCSLVAPPSMPSLEYVQSQFHLKAIAI